MDWGVFEGRQTLCPPPLREVIDILWTNGAAVVVKDVDFIEKLVAHVHVAVLNVVANTSHEAPFQIVGADSIVSR